MDNLRIYVARSGLRHDTGPNHPESIERLKTVLNRIDTDFPGIARINADPAEYGWIRRAHSAEYIARIEDQVPDHGLHSLDFETVLSPSSLDAALEAAGAVCQAVDDVASGIARRAFCAVRPPGHHAEPDHAMGFCIFNNIFVGALHAQTLGLKRIAIIDFDVHHGNGTETMTRAAQDILYISSQQWPLWPGTGDPAGNIDGKILNLALDPGTGGKEFREAYSAKVFPALEAFSPDLIMISAGFDAHRDDPLASLELEADDFFWITAELVRIAESHAGGRVVSALEGGYDLQALDVCVAAHLRALA